MSMKKEMSKMFQDSKKMVELSETFLKLSQYQAKFDHPKLALDCFTTSKTLLYWAKVGLEEHKS
jgi:hypothetical protein